MTIAIADITDGVYSHLTADSDFNTSIGGSAVSAGRLNHGQAASDSTAPYCVYFIIDSVGVDAMDCDGFDCRVQFSIWHSKAAGSRACLDVFDRLHDRLHRKIVAMSNVDAMEAELDIQRGPIIDDQFWLVQADYLFRGYES